MVYDIRRSDHILPAGVILTVRFFVKFNLARTIPSLETIKLNGNVICPTARKEALIPQINQPQTNNNAQKYRSNKDEPIYIRFK